MMRDNRSVRAWTYYLALISTACSVDSNTGDSNRLASIPNQDAFAFPVSDFSNDPHDDVRDCWAVTYVGVKSRINYTAELWGKPSTTQKIAQSFCASFEKQHCGESSSEPCEGLPAFHLGVACNRLYTWHNEFYNIPRNKNPSYALGYDDVANWVDGLTLNEDETTSIKLGKFQDAPVPETEAEWQRRNEDYKSELALPLSQVIRFRNSHPTIRMGVPHDAFNVPNSYDDKTKILVRPEFTVQLDRQCRGPAWVGYDLTSEHLGSEPRNYIADEYVDLNLSPAETKNAQNLANQVFQYDAAFPLEWQASPNIVDDVIAEFHKGHAARSGNRTRVWTEDATPPYARSRRSLTNLMSNMFVQARDSNVGVWRQFEEWLQQVAKRTPHDVYIYVIAKFPHAAIFENRFEVEIKSDVGYTLIEPAGRIRRLHRDRTPLESVCIPEKLFMVAVIVSKGNGASNFDELPGSTHVIAIGVPNRNENSKYPLSVGTVENNFRWVPGVKNVTKGFDKNARGDLVPVFDSKLFDYWTHYVVSLKDVETETGYDLLTNVNKGKLSMRPSDTEELNRFLAKLKNVGYDDSRLFPADWRGSRKPR